MPLLLLQNPLHVILFCGKIWLLTYFEAIFVPKLNYMDSTDNILTDIQYNKVLLGDFDRTDVFMRPLRCNHLIFILCTEGEVEVEINYVTYKLRSNSFVTLLPLDIVTKKNEPGNFRCKALVIPQKVYAPMTMNIDINFLKDIKIMPVVNYDGPHLDFIMQTFGMLEKAKELLSYEDFEIYAQRIIHALFVVVHGYMKLVSEKSAPMPGVMMRKRELFKKFIEKLVESYSVSREVLFYANELGVSCGYLNEVCNEVSTHSAKEIIDSAVASRLKYELSYTSKTIQELADEYNFPSQSYFSRYFKRLAGMTPSEFRKNRNS